MNNWQYELYKLTPLQKNAQEMLEFDPETGELKNFEDFVRVFETYEEAIEAAGVAIKEKQAFIETLKNEEKALRERRQQYERQVESYKGSLARSLQATNRDKFETEKVRFSFRKSTSVSISKEAVVPEEYLTVKTTKTPNKRLLKEALRTGKSINGVNIVEKQNLQIG